jgi:hypothetical protein
MIQCERALVRYSNMVQCDKTMVQDDRDMMQCDKALIRSRSMIQCDKAMVQGD